MSARAGDQKGLKAHELQPGETIEGRWVAGIPWSQSDSFRGRLSKYGGDLVLTDRRLLFDPLKVVMPSYRGGDVSGFGLEFIGGEKAFELGEIASVEPFSTRGPPRLKLTLQNGDEVVLGVLKGRSATIWSKDTAARDEAIAAISAAASTS
jgi:hypothetical protein